MKVKHEITLSPEDVKNIIREHILERIPEAKGISVRFRIDYENSGDDRFGGGPGTPIVDGIMIGYESEI